MDLSNLNMRQVAKVEELSGQSITSIGDEKAPKGKLMAALAFIVKSQEDRSFKFEDALDLTADEINEILGDAQADPKDND